ncbi:MAG: epoxyqueuosine reductase [Caulobacteraceae bacterium]|nr:epoxyqueuosine reductase [Caulobacteraceae bacterium]
MNVIDTIKRPHQKYGRAWVEKTRKAVGADLMGVLAVSPQSHPDFLYGVQAFMPGAKAAIILAGEMGSETINLIKPPAKYAGKVKTGGLLSPHVVQVTAELDQSAYQLAKLLKQEGFRTLALPSRGLPFRPGQMKAALSYCHIAEAAGMGTVGTHSFLITPEFGTRVRLTCVLTEAPLPTTVRVDPVDDCTHCLDCVKICPVGAITSPGPGRRSVVDGMKCKMYRDMVDNCGLCQKVCSYSTHHSEITDGPLVAKANFPGMPAVSYDQVDQP